jgi:MFS family permease
MVGPRELPNAVALNTGLFNGSRIIGPAIAGVIIATVGTGLCFVLNAVSFLAVLTALVLVRSDELHAVAKDPSARVVDGIRRAFAYVWNDPDLRLILGVVTIVSTVGFNFHVLVPLLAADTLHVGPEGFGLLSAAFGAGALVGALATASMRGASWRMFAIGTSAFGVLAIMLAPVQSPALAGALLFAIGVSFTLFTANANALVQLSAPDHLRGRLIGLYLLAFVGVAPVGGLFAGWLAEIGGTTLAFAVAGLTALVAIGVANTRRERRLATG